jgi:Lar family restriction alleviation protein
MMEIIMEEIKPCPFCGTAGEARIELQEPSPDSDNDWYEVRCDYCGARGGESLSKEGAVREWNKRA